MVLWPLGVFGGCICPNQSSEKLWGRSPLCLSLSFPPYISLSPSLPSSSLPLSLLSVPHDVLLHRASVCRPLEMLKKTSGCYGGKAQKQKQRAELFIGRVFLCQHGCLEKPSSFEGPELSSLKLACCPLYLEPDDLNSSLGRVTLSRCCYL